MPNDRGGSRPYMAVPFAPGVYAYDMGYPEPYEKLFPPSDGPAKLALLAMVGLSKKMLSEDPRYGSIWELVIGRTAIIGDN